MVARQRRTSTTGTDSASEVVHSVVPPALGGLVREVDQLVEQPAVLSPKSDFFPSPTFALARKDASGVRKPQTIAHRGYKAQFPENTMGAFRGAVKVGADALETDIHLSKDGVVVLSHDPDLKRCFGRPEKIIDCDYEFLSKLRTLKEPHDAMPRLVDLLEYLKQPGLEDIWVMLDIKLDNDTETVMRLIALSIASVSPSPNRPWQSRILLGCWAAKYLPFCSKYLPGFPITHIGISILYASHWRKVLNISFNMLQFTLMTPWGRSFTRKAQRDNRPVFAWTVNAERHMRWDIRHGLDGVITDDPKRFLEIRREWREGMRDGNGLGVLMWLRVVWFNLLTMVFGAVYRYGYGHFNDTGELVRFKASS